MPAFREKDGRPSYEQQPDSTPRTLSELSATVGKPEVPPVVRLADGSDLRTDVGHIAEFADGADTSPVKAEGSGHLTAGAVPDATGELEPAVLSP